MLTKHPSRVVARIGALLCAFTFLPSANAQSIRISEFMAANATTYPDNTDFDDYSDWIELENTTGSPVSLDGYYLSDDPTEPLKWSIPTGASIPANGFLVIRADGFDAAAGDTYRRDAAPWDNFETRNYHTNFKLSADGESVVLSSFDSPTQQITYLPLGAQWRYFDQGSLPAANWFSPTFDDSSWDAGAAQLGYGEGDEETTISFGPDEDGKYPTCYFRTTFQVTDPANITSLTCRALIDDGAVFYVNGAEVDRLRIADGPVGYGTFSTGNAPEDTFNTITLPVSSLVAGTNTIAVEVHQDDEVSSDVSFNLEITGSESDGEPATIVDSVDFGFQLDDVSYGRNPADPDTWTYFGDPTPNAPNTTFTTTDRVASAPTTATPAGGFYAAAQSVTLTAASGTVRYTRDGSIPHSNSPAYTAPIDISSTDVIRARTFEDGRIPGPLATHTYFIDEPTRPLPVVGFTVDPEEFFDNTLGIYENVYKGREAFNTLEYYAPDRSLAFKVNSGTKIGGENIWRFDQKPLNIATRGKYGDDLINYQIFPSEDIGTYDAIGFRNGGDNWPNAMLRDPMSPSIVKGQMRNDVAFYQPVVLYMNGAYWGIHNARLRMGDSYFFNRYGIQPGGFDLLVKEHAPPSGSTQLVVKDGTADAYIAFEDFVENNDMSDPANYQIAIDQMDLDSFIDYCAMTDYVYESSWHHNQEFWRERKDGGKWRWNINDIDRGFNSSNVTSSLIDDLEDRHPIFEALIENPDFVQRFVQRYAAHLNSTYHPDRIADIIQTLADEVEPEIQRHVDKWDDQGGFSVSRRLSEIAEIKEFAIDRIEHVYSDTANILNFNNNTSDLALTVTPPAGGRVTINGVPMLSQYSLTATLYEDIPFDLTAEPAPGYIFTGWSNGDTTSTIPQTLTGNTSLTANFAPSGETLVPATIAADTTLATGLYTATGDITVDTGSTLTIQQGVTLRMTPGASIYVNGTLNIEGTEAAPVTIEPRTGTTWGAIGFKNATGTLSHLLLTGATHTALDPVNLKAAISGLDSTISINHADIAAPFPVFARGGSLTVRSTHIHPTNTGDGINIKGGSGLVENCTFLGNDAPDTDAIDFDNVVDGIIRDNRIYAFIGSNSDGIDIGEGCINLLLSRNRIYNSSDKGVSVGQGSVVNMQHNLIVGCALGVGIKDFGSVANIDQNTFAGNAVAVASYEKNFNKGGGEANITNTIFSRSKDDNTTVDPLSSLTVSYSLSDTLALPAGPGNLTADPLFTNPGGYDFSLTPASPAIDAGDPAHAPDPDATRADIGAAYVYDPDDYPFQIPNVVVINEILSHSSAAEGDYIELYNTSTDPVDIGGWFISDSASNLEKYRIPDGTTIPGNGYIVFTEADHFGVGPTAFAFSENGETAYIYGPGDGLLLEYLEEESFGPSASDVSRGRHFKASTNTYNFVAMAAQTPGTANGLPKVGPVVISQIMYHPDNGDAEYLELLNISGAAVTLYNPAKDESWRITDGIDFSFSKTSPVTLPPGGKCLLVRNEAVYRDVFTPPAGAQIFQWTSGGLSNSGERIELSSPGEIDADGIRKFIREDRVDYSDSAPWPIEADQGILALTRIDVTAYGNDPANWQAVLPSPELDPYDQWVIDNNLPEDHSRKTDDADLDGLTNFLEYAIGTSPTSPASTPASSITSSGTTTTIVFEISTSHPDLTYTIECSPDMTSGSWSPIPTEILPYHESTNALTATQPLSETKSFYRLVVRE